MSASKLPVLGFAAWSGTGKTTLLKQLLPRLTQRGIRVGCIKHAHHDFDVDIPGKDSYELRHAGASQMLIASSKRWALMTEAPRSDDPCLNELLQHLDSTQLDMVLVEGFKAEIFPKIELYRPSVGKPLQYLDDPSIIAVATDDLDLLPDQNKLPVLNLNDISAIEAFVFEFCQTHGDQG